MPMTPDQVAEMRAAAAQRKAQPAVAPVAEPVVAPVVVAEPAVVVAPVVAPEPVVAPVAVAPVVVAEPVATPVVAPPVAAPVVAPPAPPARASAVAPRPAAPAPAPAATPAAPGHTADERRVALAAIEAHRAQKAAEAAAQAAILAADVKAQAQVAQANQAEFEALSDVEQRRTAATREAAATMLARRAHAAVAEGERYRRGGPVSSWGTNTEAEDIMQSRGQGLAVAPGLPEAYDVARAKGRGAKAAAQVKFDDAKEKVLVRGRELYGMWAKERNRLPDRPLGVKALDRRAVLDRKREQEEAKHRLATAQTRYNQFRALYVVTLGGNPQDLIVPPPQAPPPPE